jgi:hypothetical protein
VCVVIRIARQLAKLGATYVDQLQRLADEELPIVVARSQRLPCLAKHGGHGERLGFYRVIDDSPALEQQQCARHRRARVGTERDAMRPHPVKVTEDGRSECRERARLLRQLGLGVSHRRIQLLDGDVWLELVTDF